MLNKKRICVIGNSYVGAVFLAYESSKSSLQGLEIDFYTAAGTDFPLMDIVGNSIVNVKFSNSNSMDGLGDYDCYFVYGDLLSPQGIVELERRLKSLAYSRQVINCTLADAICSAFSYRLCLKLKKITKSPVHLISHNVLQQSKLHLSGAEYFDALKVLENTLGGDVYHAFPVELFDDNYVPKDIYHKDSVMINGKPGAQHQGHDRYHMNAQGGALVLNSILRKLGVAGA